MISIQYFNCVLSPIPSNPHAIIIFSPDSHYDAYVFIDTSSILLPKPSIEFLNHLNALHCDTVIKFVNVESQEGLRGVVGFEEVTNVVKQNLRVGKP